MTVGDTMKTPSDTFFFDAPVRVRYADTDRMGIVYYGTYPMYFEAGRTEYMRNRGFTYHSFEEMGYHLVVVGMNIRYYNTATYDDLLIVRTSISALKSRSLTFQYEIFKGDTRIVEGHTVHICTNSDRKSVLIPSSLLNILKDVTTQ